MEEVDNDVIKKDVAVILPVPLGSIDENEPNSAGPKAAILDVNSSYQLYEDEGVMVNELVRTEDKILEEHGVSQQIRMSVESYVNDEDTVLPETYMYTSEPSQVNMDTTLAWVRAKCEETRLQQMRTGALFSSKALHWIKLYSLKVTDENDLETTLSKIKTREEEYAKYYQDASSCLDAAKVPLFEMITSLGIDADTIDTDIQENWSSASRKRKVLDQLIEPTIGKTLTGLTIALGHESQFRDDFKEYQKTVGKMFQALLKAQKEVAAGNNVNVDLTSFEGNIAALNKKTVDYTVLSAQMGYGHAMSMDFIDAILKEGCKAVELLDDSYSAELMSIRQTFIDSYNLDNVADKTGIEVESVESLLQAMDENNTVLTSLLDALRVIVSVYNSLITTASAKNSLVSSYGIFLQSISE